MKEDKTNPNVNERQICRALISAATDETYDFQCVAVPSENKDVKFSRTNGEYFYQILRAKQENLDVSRLDSGLPLFDNHPDYDKANATATLGISTGYSFDDRGLIVRCKWGARADEALRSDVKNGIIKTVSIEGTVSEYEIERKQGELPRYYATMWTPESLSLAPIPNDIGAQIEVKRAIEKQITPVKEEIKSIYKQLTQKFAK
jgi:hypothetical protein